MLVLELEQSGFSAPADGMRLQRFAEDMDKLTINVDLSQTRECKRGLPIRRRYGTQDAGHAFEAGPASCLGDRCSMQLAGCYSCISQGGVTIGYEVRAVMCPRLSVASYYCETSPRRLLRRNIWAVAVIH